MEKGLYIHFPFCISKCLYCDFNSTAAPDSLYPEWLHLLLDEAACRIPRGTAYTTLYIGGGTPSLMPPPLFSRLMKGLYGYFDLSRLKEITVEANPSSLRSESLAIFKEWRVKRLSIGIQSFNPALLRTLGRSHTPEEGFRTAAEACQTGIEVSLDLMFGLPGQTMEHLTADITAALGFPISHLSLYGLTIEPGTPFHRFEQEKRLPPVDREKYDEMYFTAADMLEQGGLFRYEVSSFSKPGKECLHNLNYWNHTEYSGLGPGAHSLTAMVRTASPGLFETYRDWVRSACPPEEGMTDTLKDEQLYEETVWLGLRTVRGIDTRMLMTKFGRMPSGERLERWISRECLKKLDDNIYHLSGRGWAFLDEITVDLMGG